MKKNSSLAEAELNSILQVLDLKSVEPKKDSDFDGSELRLNYFNQYFEKKSIRELLRFIIDRRKTLLGFYNNIASYDSASEHKDSEDDKRSCGYAEIGCVSLEYAPPLKLPIRNRASVCDGTPEGNRLENEIFFTSLRIVEVATLTGYLEGKNIDLDFFLDHHSSFRDFLESDIALSHLGRINSELYISLFTGFKMNSVSPVKAYHLLFESKEDLDYSAALRRIIILIYAYNPDILFGISQDQLIKLLLIHKIEAKSPKTYQKIVSTILEELNIKKQVSENSRSDNDA